MNPSIDKKYILLYNFLTKNEVAFSQILSIGTRLPYPIEQQATPGHTVEKEQLGCKNALKNWLYNNICRQINGGFHCSLEGAVHDLADLVRSQEYEGVKLIASGIALENKKKSSNETRDHVEEKIEEAILKNSWRMYWTIIPGKDSMQNLKKGRMLVFNPSTIGEMRALVRSLLFLARNENEKGKKNPYQISHIEVFYNTHESSQWLPDEKVIVYYKPTLCDASYPFFDDEGRGILSKLRLQSKVAPGVESMFFPFYEEHGGAAWASYRQDKGFVSSRLEAICGYLEAVGRLSNPDPLLNIDLKKFKQGLESYFDLYQVNGEAPHLNGGF